MCQTFTELSYLNPYRRIRLCEHHTVWLYWDQGLLFLHLDDLEALNLVLDHAIAGLAVEANPSVAVQCVGADHYLVRVRGFAFYLTWEHMAEMAELVCLASDAVTDVSPPDMVITTQHDPFLDNTIRISLN